MIPLVMAGVGLVLLAIFALSYRRTLRDNARNQALHTQQQQDHHRAEVLGATDRPLPGAGRSDQSDR